MVLELVALLGFPGVAALFEASLPPSLVRKNIREEVDKKNSIYSGHLKID